MRINLTTSVDLYSKGFRLDASYHASDGNKSFRFINKWKSSKYDSRQLNLVGDVCFPNGIFIGGRAKRIYVEDPKHGIPFLSSSDMLLASMDGVKLISKKQPELDSQLLHPSWTLISRSGTIGNTVYTRKDMEGLAGSEHIMRVVANPQKIPPGYLYAFLSSDVGTTMIRQGTFGAVIDTIEPKYIASLPIPRLDPVQEEQIHQLVEQSADLRTEAQCEINLLKSKLELEILEIPQGYHSKWPSEWSYSLGQVQLSTVDTRLDAFFHVGHAIEYRKFVTTGPALTEVAEIQRPGMFKRNYIAKGGIPFLSGVDVYQIKPKPRLWISPTTNLIDELLITKNQTILVQADGQRYGILGRPVFSDQSFLGSAVSDHLVRIIPHSPTLGGYIFIYLSTNAGRRELIRSSYGTSIPTIPTKAFQLLQVPGIYSTVGQEIGDRAISALEKRTHANQLEDLAQELLAENLGIVNSN